MAIIGPFNVGYPVIFRSGGDTTRVAFGKHIQEIERIYGILNALDSDKISASDLDGKLGNFKPNMSFSDISGSLDMSRISGNLDFSRISGNVPASRVVGNLSNANIDAGNVNGLQALVKSLIPPTSGGTGDGITDVEADVNGYALFANGLMFQWGRTARETLPTASAAARVNFSKEFTNQCLIVTGCSVTGKSEAEPCGQNISYINSWDKSGFIFCSSVAGFLSGRAPFSYFAIGY